MNQEIESKALQEFRKLLHIISTVGEKTVSLCRFSIWWLYILFYFLLQTPSKKQLWWVRALSTSINSIQRQAEPTHSCFSEYRSETSGNMRQ
jgi:hypothetical protein